MYYYQSEDSISNSFLIVPKSLFSNKYAAVSANAKIMYIHMLDRCKLSMKNHWVDEAKNIFIIYTIEQLSSLMNLKKSKIHMLLNELEMCQLIKRKRTGGTYPNQIYVANLDAQVEAEKKAAEKTAETNRKKVERIDYPAPNPTNIVNNEEEQNDDGLCHGMPEYLRKKLHDALGIVLPNEETEATQVENTKTEQEIDVHKNGDHRSDVHKCEHQNVEVNSGDIHECGHQNAQEPKIDIHENGHQQSDIHKYIEKIMLDIHKRGDQMDDNTKNTPQNAGKQVDVHDCGGQRQLDVHETENLISTDVDTNNNNINNNKNINACARARDAGVSSTHMDIEAVKHQIGYGALVQQHPEDIDAVNAIVSVMTDMAAAGESASHSTVLVGDRYVPIKEIISQYSSLTIYDINNVLRAAKGKQIKNYRKYFTVCLYNAKENQRQPEKHRHSFCNFTGRDLSATIEALEMLQANPYASAIC